MYGSNESWVFRVSSPFFCNQICCYKSRNGSPYVSPQCISMLLPSCLYLRLHTLFSPRPQRPTTIRFGELRKLKFMLPMDDLRLGWPDAFPGKYATKMRRGTSNEVSMWRAVERTYYEHLASLAVLSLATWSSRAKKGMEANLY